MLYVQTEVRDFHGSTGFAGCRKLRPLWIAAFAMVVSSVGCTRKPATVLTEVDVAVPVRRDVPVYSEWIGTTVGYIDAQIHRKDVHDDEFELRSGEVIHA